MQVGVCVSWQIIVDSNIDFLNINSTAKNVGGDADSLLEVLEFFVAFDPSHHQHDVFLSLLRYCNLPLLLVYARVNCNAGEVAIDENIVELGTPNCAPYEDDDLVEGECVEEIIQLSVFLRLAKFDVVLVQTVKSQLGFIINEQLRWVLHEFSADRANLLGKSGAEHHDLLLGWCGPEDFLDIPSHVYQI